jgi:hypothetical protein
MIWACPHGVKIGSGLHYRNVTNCVAASKPTPNDEVALPTNETDLSQSTTPLLSPPKTRPAIARTDC